MAGKMIQRGDALSVEFDVKRKILERRETRLGFFFKLECGHEVFRDKPRKPPKKPQTHTRCPKCG